ncbi:hypothetical protein GCK32_020789 [Trichostrongylus colubriformis]|uniref:Uncharacterized protein n=1 Tax=Trichostrongylus colubriformis TaxID=6319 RepID=A0AAN8G6T7_TRICO
MVMTKLLIPSSLNVRRSVESDLGQKTTAEVAQLRFHEWQRSGFCWITWHVHGTGSRLTKNPFWSIGIFNSNTGNANWSGNRCTDFLL